MADFTAKDVQDLRNATGAGMLDSKRALTETNWQPRGSREVAEGTWPGQGGRKGRA